MLILHSEYKKIVICIKIKDLQSFCTPKWLLFSQNNLSELLFEVYSTTKGFGVWFLIKKSKEAQFCISTREMKYFVFVCLQKNDHFLLLTGSFSRKWYIYD